MKTGRGGREERGGCQRPKIESQEWKRKGRTRPWAGEGKRQSNQHRHLRERAAAASTHVILPSSLKEKRFHFSNLSLSFPASFGCSLKDEEGNETRERVWESIQKGWGGAESPSKVAEREGERERGMTEREREDLLWIVICHVRLPSCSYTRVLLLILNRR